MIRWNLRTIMAKKHQIYSATELQKLIVKKTGILISVANLCKFLNKPPKMLRLETIEIICSALECELSSILKVSPKVFNPDKKSKLSFKNTPKTKIGIKAFPEPKDYADR